MLDGKQIGGLIAIAVGLCIAGAQIVREVPWQAGIAVGFFIAILGGAAVVDSGPLEDEDSIRADERLSVMRELQRIHGDDGDDEPPPADIRPLPRRPGA